MAGLPRPGPSVAAQHHSKPSASGALRGRAQDPALIWDEPSAMPEDYGANHLCPHSDECPHVNQWEREPNPSGPPDSTQSQGPLHPLTWFDSQHMSGSPAAGCDASCFAGDQLRLSAVGKSTGEVPAVLKDIRRGLSRVSSDHLHRIIAQLCTVEQIQDIPTWLPIIQRLALECALLLSPTAVNSAASKLKSLDPRSLVKVKKLADDSAPTDSCVVQGIVFSKNLTHRSMPRSFSKPRVLLLAGALEYQKTNRLLTLDTIIPQEPEYMRACIQKAARFKPDVILVEKSVSRMAQVRPYNILSFPHAPMLQWQPGTLRFVWKCRQHPSL
jgi:hypothetical protein